MTKALWLSNTERF